mgnify:CR=1 FL=1
MKEIFQPTIDAMREEGRPFQGCLYFGLMLTQDGPKVIEYNSRFGDPETQVVLPRLKTDLVEILEACIDGTLKDLDIQWSDEAAACVVMASGGYPKSYPKGIEIKGFGRKRPKSAALRFITPAPFTETADFHQWRPCPWSDRLRRCS